MKLDRRLGSSFYLGELGCLGKPQRFLPIVWPRLLAGLIDDQAMLDHRWKPLRFFGGHNETRSPDGIEFLFGVSCAF
jgi:hypothetical protein